MTLHPITVTVGGRSYRLETEADVREFCARIAPTKAA